MVKKLKKAKIRVNNFRSIRISKRGATNKIRDHEADHISVHAFSLSAKAKPFTIRRKLNAASITRQELLLNKQHLPEWALQRKLDPDL